LLALDAGDRLVAPHVRRIEAVREVWRGVGTPMLPSELAAAN
jgi:hypothetical protein